MYLSPNVRLIIHSPPSLRTFLGVEEGSPSVAWSAATSWASEKEEEEDETEDVQLHELVEEGVELTDDEIGIKEHQDDENAGCRGARELGGGTSSAGDGDGDNINYYDLRSLLAKIWFTICPDFRYRATGIFWDYTTLIFGPSWRG